MLTLNSDLIEQLLQVNRSRHSSALCSSVLHVHNRFGSTRAFFIKQYFHLQLNAVYNRIILWLEYKHIIVLVLRSMAQVLNITIWLFFQRQYLQNAHCKADLNNSFNALGISFSVKMLDHALTGFISLNLGSPKNCKDKKMLGHKHHKQNIFFKKKQTCVSSKFCGKTELTQPVQRLSQVSTRANTRRRAGGHGLA